MVYAFWEGEMPDYIKLCMKTWKFDYTLLDYNTVQNYMKFDKSKMTGFTLPQIADYIRVHVLRNHGGYWLDTDTIMLTDKLPEENILGYPNTRTNTIGFLHTEPHSEMFNLWAEHQDRIVANKYHSQHWDVLGNLFTDSYVREHEDIIIGDITPRWAETYMVKDNISRYRKYIKFYFESSHFLPDLKVTDMLMLHNSWTPAWYKAMSENEIMANNHTLSNILKEVLR